MMFKLTSPSYYWEINYLIANFLYRKSWIKIFYYIYWPIWRIVSIFLWVEIYGKTKIGSGLKIKHFWWIFINPYSIIWENCIIYNNVTIGVKEYEWWVKAPIIGNNVKIWTWSKILGGITIWDNVCIWANSVVLKNFPNNCVIWWVPAKILKKIN